MKSSLGSIFLSFALANLILATSVLGDDRICYNLDSCCNGVANGESFGDEHDCTRYIICLQETAYTYTCSNLERPYYSLETKTCDTIENVYECSGGTRPPVQPTTLPPIIPTTDRIDGNCTEPGTYLIPYPGNCSMYMVCSDYILLPEPQTCPPGTLFDPALGQCNLEHLVECAPVCPPTGTINLPDPKNCSKYWLCALGNPSHQECLPGLVFDEKLGQCNIADLTFCPNLCPATGTVNLPHATDCKRYWLCVNGSPNIQQCAPDLAFDPELGQCNIESEVDCSNRISTIKCPSWNHDSHESVIKGSATVTQVQNPNNCAEYFLCDKRNGNLVDIRKCPENTWFFKEDGVENSGTCRKPKFGEHCAN